MIYKIFPVTLFLLFSIYSSKTNFRTPIKTQKKELASTLSSSSDANIETLYKSLNSNDYNLPNLESFKEALKGYYTLKEKGLIQKDILTLVDFSLSSNVKRLWVIDLNTNTTFVRAIRIRKAVGKFFTSISSVSY